MNAVEMLLVWWQCEILCNTMQQMTSTH